MGTQTLKEVIKLVGVFAELLRCRLDANFLLTLAIGEVVPIIECVPIVNFDVPDSS